MLSKGIWERLNVCPETMDILAKNGIEVEVLQTEAAVERFNVVVKVCRLAGYFIPLLTDGSPPGAQLALQLPFATLPAKILMRARN